MSKPRPHSELIKAWADGADVQSKSQNGEWYDDEEPWWLRDLEYRVKPKDVIKNFRLESHFMAGLRMTDVTGLPWNKGEDWLQVVFDSESGKMKSATVLNNN